MDNQPTGDNDGRGPTGRNNGDGGNDGDMVNQLFPSKKMVQDCIVGSAYTYKVQEGYYYNRNKEGGIIKKLL